MTSKDLISVILLAGGAGQRMKSATPKQFLNLKGKLIAKHSFDLFMSLDMIAEVIVVCDPQYCGLFTSSKQEKPLKFATPGKRRQDSVYQGFLSVSPSSKLICIHDSARPLITAEIVRNVIGAAEETGAAAAAVPVKFTVKESDEDRFVAKTHDRSRLWEIQTPQAIKFSVLEQGFQRALDSRTTVTDDVSLAELAGHPVKLVQGAYSNIKITTPEDLALAEHLL